MNDMRNHWSAPTDDLLATVQAWWEPLLAMAPTLRGAVGANLCAPFVRMSLGLLRISRLWPTRFAIGIR